MNDDNKYDDDEYDDVADKFQKVAIDKWWQFISDKWKLMQMTKVDKQQKVQVTIKDNLQNRKWQVTKS